MDMGFQPSQERCVTARFGDQAQSHTHGYSFGWKRGWNRGCQEDRAKPSSPVIYLTTHADIGTMVRANDTSSAGYLLKSFEPEELRSAVKRPLRPIEPEGILGSKGPFPARLYLPSGILYQGSFNYGLRSVSQAGTAGIAHKLLPRTSALYQSPSSQRGPSLACYP